MIREYVGQYFGWVDYQGSIESYEYVISALRYYEDTGKYELLAYYGIDET